MPNWDHDEECTAAPGVMGHHACHRYPGCGCGDSRDESPPLRDPVEVMMSTEILGVPMVLPVQVERSEAKRRGRPRAGSDTARLVMNLDAMLASFESAEDVDFDDAGVDFSRTELALLAVALRRMEGERDGAAFRELRRKVARALGSKS